MMDRKLSDYFDIRYDAAGNEYMEVYLDGIALLRLALTNKGTGFTREERAALGLEGLLPPKVSTLEQQVERVYRGFLRMPDPLSKYQYLRDLQDRAEIVFYALLSSHLEEMLPIVYTPTVGQAVQVYSHIYRTARGLSFTPLNIDNALAVTGNYPWNDVRMIVATDSSAILGIGDQGYGGLAIAIGKLALYTAAGGVSPFHTMPVKLDVGTDRQSLIDDPQYLGVPQRRLRGEAYFEFIDKFVTAVHQRWPGAIIQWEDFSKDVAFEILARYRDKVPCFNDDIQGTGSMALAGVRSACRIKGENLADQRILVFGAGAAGIGVASALIDGMVRDGSEQQEARSRMFVFDSRGLLLGERAMEAYKQPFAHPLEAIAGWTYDRDTPGLIDVITNAGITVLIGLSGQCGGFNQPVIEAVHRNTPRPVIFPLSNPSSITEALPDDILHWTCGQAIVATGSPFPDVDVEGRTVPISQGNNAFIFPGLGLAALLVECSRVTDGMVLAAAEALAEYTARAHPDDGCVFPPVGEMPEVSIHVAARVIARALADGVAQRKDVPDTGLEEWVRLRFWRPRHIPFIKGKRPPAVTKTGD
jgi:malate dehydrogenase (oxaloacetate-decarboxylating)